MQQSVRGGGFSPKGFSGCVSVVSPASLLFRVFVPSKARTQTIAAQLTAETEKPEKETSNEGPQAMATDPDEAYVSGGLSSGGFGSIGDGTAAPSSLSGPPSFSAEAGGERGKLGSRGRDGMGKSLSQPQNRRKKAHPNRHGGAGAGSHREVSPGKAGYGTRLPSGPLATPTTQLSQQINLMGLMSPMTSGGKRTLAERTDDMSPMSDGDGGTLSLTDPGYDSLPHGHPSLEQPGSLSDERGRRGGGRNGVMAGERQKMDISSALKPRGQERLLQVGHKIRDRSESPVVPPVGESVEIVTGPPDQDHTAMQQFDGASFKRAATGSLNWERLAAKNPRLTEVPTASLHRPIRVPTIVSPAQVTSRTIRSKSKKTVTVGINPERSGPSHSPSHNSMEESESHSAGASPSHQTAAASRVNFSSIEELSRSARQPDMEVETDHLRTPPQLAQVISLIRTARDSATFSGRRSPQPAVASPTPPTLMDSLSPRCSARSVSPHSPRSPHTPQTTASSGSGSNSSGAGGESGRREKGKVGKGGEGEEGEVKKQSALLQVSEAHLAILPDEDGDTPLHLAIIHENVRLTQYLVKLIVRVYMNNLDIANNMRQTPLHLAIITRQPHIVQMLVQAGASVNFPDRKGNTAIHLASARRDMQVLQLLARATSPLPDFNCKNFAGLAPVHLATREASIDVLKFLFQMTANKNAMDACSGRTSLHYAVEAENFILVNFLLENGCNVNATTFSGNTPLHIAAGRRLKEIVALLMAYGANPALANGEGDFPTDLPASLLMQRARMNAH